MMAHDSDYIYKNIFSSKTDPTPNTQTMAADIVTRIREAVGSSVLWDDCHVLALAAARAAGAPPPGGWGIQGQSPTSVRNVIKSSDTWYWAYDTATYDLDWTNRAQLSQYLKAGDIIRAKIGSYNHTMTVVEVSASDIKIVDNGRKSQGWVPVIEHSLFDYTITDNTASIIRLKSSGVTYIQPPTGGSGDPTLAVNDVQVLESAGSLAFTVSLNKALDKDVTVNAYTVAQTAFASQGDYEPVNKTITIRAGATSTSVVVPLTDDTKPEGTETIELRLRNAKNATIGDGVGVGTILDNDGGATPTLPKLTVSDLSVNEGGGAANVTVSLDRVATTDVSFAAATYVGTASGAAGDYTGFTSKAGVIRAGSLKTTVTVAITNDRLAESTETFQVGVFDVRNATVAQERGTVTIIDNDVATIQPPKVSVGDASVTEGGNAVFSLSLDKASTSDVTLLLTTYKGTANASGSGTDYTGFIDKKVTIRAGTTSTTVSVATVDDHIGERSETFALEIAQSTGATIARRRGTGTIADNDGGGFPAIPTDYPLTAAADDVGTGTASRFDTASLPGADGRWLAVAAADFNGDGYADIVLRDQVGGQNAIWFMQGAERVDGAFLPDAPSLSWQIVGAADMNQDGAADLVWRNDETGENALWLMNGSSRIDTVALPSTVKTEWRIGGIADLNGDENADILWRNQATGENAVWLMEGTERLDAVALPTTSDLDWRMVGAGDINEDGSADVLWHNRATGATSYWAFDGLTRIETGTLGQTANFDWTAFAVADLDGSGGADVLWRDPVNGQHAAWLVGITS
jgi:hypothetical protein